MSDERKLPWAGYQGRRQTTEQILRARVWKLRPALQQAIRTLRDVHKQYEGFHEAGHIWMVIEAGEQALAETAGSTTIPGDLPARP
jgi:hypothetical protein